MTIARPPSSPDPLERPSTDALPLSQQTRTVRAVAGILVPLIVTLATLGGIGSFTTVRTMAEPWFGDRAWSVPIGMDVGILVLLAWDLLMEYLGMPWRMLRWVAWSYIASTVAINVLAANGNVAGSLMHAAMPVLFITVMEGVRHLIRHRVGLASGTRGAPIPARRWLLAPVSTALLWRRMALWNIATYLEALDLEYRRLVTVGELQQRYGRMAWRWRTPLPERLGLRLMAANLPEHAPPNVCGPVPQEKNAQPTRPEWLSSELLLAARRVLDEARLENRVLTRTELGQQLREQGLTISNERLTELRQHASVDAGAQIGTA
ncbi:DUF2637 domain-containing protein [Actinomadura rupiterrae]|uniref:DUF2637 domain-containing protein n=1 Tax=Actinomadura rupiterrae TaxID=559627 RepID=UPI0020A41E56|nr:DUF2637 domain-containing protein [Actinomadura rupiterrae]MCP2337934.1 hypothetical protein [Actinomadura rupiterrae]